MPRIPLTTDQKIANTKAMLAEAHAAVVVLTQALDDGDSQAALKAAKVLEATGCYARRVAPDLTPSKASGPQEVVIVGPNLRDQSRGEFHVHALGCADLKRDPNMRNEDQSMILHARSREDVAEYVYEDMMAESGSPASDYIGEFHFAPCCTI